MRTYELILIALQGIAIDIGAIVAFVLLFRSDWKVFATFITIQDPPVPSKLEMIPRSVHAAISSHTGLLHLYKRLELRT